MVAKKGATAESATKVTGATKGTDTTSTGTFVAIVEGEVMDRDVKDNNRATLRPYRYAFLLKNADAPLFVIRRHYLKDAIRKQFGVDLKPYTHKLVAIYRNDGRGAGAVADYRGIPMQFLCMPQAKKYVLDHNICGVTEIFGSDEELLDVKAFADIEHVRELLMLWTECKASGDMTGYRLALKRHTKEAVEKEAVMPEDAVDAFDMSAALATFDKGVKAKVSATEGLVREEQIEVPQDAGIL